jgi:hypothetical protein
MHCHPLRVIALLAALVCACAHDHVRLDGTSPASFAASHRRLVESLSPADQTRLMVAEIVICTAATPGPVTLGVPPQVVPLEAVRTQLNGKTFKEIVRLSESLHVTVKVGFITKPDL